MGRLKHLYLAVLLIANILFAQNSITGGKPSAGESIFIHANATSLMSGETLYCKFYCLNPADHTPGLISKIAYAELIGSDLKSVFKHKITLKDGVGQGDFFIPATLPSGNYKLIGYTKWMLDHDTHDFFEQDITVINPFRPYEGKTGTVTPAMSAPAHRGNTLSIQTNKAAYSTREKATVKITAAGLQAKGHYSLSVRKIDALPAGQPHRAEDFTADAWPMPSLEKSSASLPELRGELITGMLISKKGNTNLSNKTIALSAPGETFIFKIVQTDRSGRFGFILDQYPENAAFVIQVMENDRQDYAIQLDENKTPDLSGLKFPNELILSPDMKNAIEARSVATQIENAYYEQKKDSTAASVKPAPFFHPLEKQYILDDYTRFPTLKETITEVLTEIYVRKSGENRSLHLRNMTMDAEIYGPPLILADGLLIQDAEALFDYGAGNIEKVSLVNEPYIYGPKTFSGVISFGTKSHDFKSKLTGDFIKHITLERPLSDKTYFSPDYTTVDSRSRIPDYRYQLIFVPEIALENTENEIAFYTSDISGKFEVVLEGFTDTGIPVSATEVFEVK